MLTALNEFKRQMAKQMSGPSMFQMLQELKSYPKAPVLVVKTFAALFVTLKVQKVAGGFRKHLGPKWNQFPQDEQKLQALWTYVRSCIQLSSRHPDNLIRTMTQDSKVHGDMQALDPETKIRVNAGEALIGGVLKEDLEKSSKAAGILHDWITVAIKLVRIQEEVYEEAEKERTDN
ncbi:hypothetical protein CYMTET_33695 [Cymbomonas tetramitiformis]|uniref:Uncharacterized protein n=1 Tax=Cymbomonas tetramitiformis TaxID=36881 RepID=A0AAE0KQP7_9CHLO|nr:hypothetical protein CYMTET_33695 [Cymbomonas tetramitiformis]